MKNLYKFLPLAIITLFVFTACSTPIAEDSAIVQTPTSDSEFAANEFPGSGYRPDLECSLIKNEQNRQSCESQINEMIGNMIESEVISRFDLTRCKELEKEIGTNCQNIISEAGVEGPISDDEMASFNEAVQGTFLELGGNDVASSPFSTFDPAKCATLKTPGYKEYCEKQITQQLEQVKFEQIVQSGNVKRCDELGDDQINQCKNFFGVEIFDGAPDVVPTIEPDDGFQPGAIVEPTEEPVAPDTE